MAHDHMRQRLIIARLVVEITRGFARVYYPKMGLARSRDLQTVAMAVFIGEAGGRPMSLSGVARYIDMPPASVQRKLNTLIRLGYVIRRGRCYCLDQRLNSERVTELTLKNVGLVLGAARILSKMENNRNVGNPTQLP